MEQSTPTWTRQGLVLPRSKDSYGSHVMGDPCIVWDSEIDNWRMILFSDPPGHGQAVHLGNPAEVGPGTWQFEGPLTFTNPEAFPSTSTHKPWIILDPYRPNQAAKINGRFGLVVVSWLSETRSKVIQQAWSDKLAGPWTLEEGITIPLGEPADFDARHVDAVSAYYFEERQELLYFYMGYPQQAQDRAVSPYGSAQAFATRKSGETTVTKGGVILEPCQQSGHWASGWVGGLQILPGKEHRWIAIANASPSAPDPRDKSIAREEPAPSLGGFAYCDEEWPVSNWQWYSQPVEWIDMMPQEAIDAGEGVNFWRQYILLLPDGKAALFYNSGSYGKEQMYMKITGDALM
ncbi:MAG: hypothetical protein JWP00_149 [Chloroflexi bacterium]|nr:hypothetical protein [Chloroflexota bacterium]